MKISTLLIAGVLATPLSAMALKPATIDDIEIPADPGYLAPDSDPFTLTCGNFTFHGAQFSYGDMTYWNGYVFSALTSNVYESLNDQYLSAPGGGCDGSHFVVAFPETYPITANESQVIQGMYVTNSAYTYNSLKNGDDFSRKAEPGDWFKATVKADNGNEIDIYLADLRSENPDEHFILDTWEWVDLTPLGEVGSITFTFSGSIESNGYLATPTYICLDNIGYAAPQDGIESVSLPAAEITVIGRSIQAPAGSTIYALDGSKRNADALIPGVYVVATPGCTPAKVVIR